MFFFNKNSGDRILFLFHREFVFFCFCFVLLCFGAESNLQECFCDMISFLNFIICFAVAELNFARLFGDRS